MSRRRRSHTAAVERGMRRGMAAFRRAAEKTRLRGEPDDTTPRISQTFAAMGAAATPDPSRRGVEFYRRRDEVDLPFPLAR